MSSWQEEGSWLPTGCELTQLANQDTDCGHYGVYNGRSLNFNILQTCLVLFVKRSSKEEALYLTSTCKI